MSDWLETYRGSVFREDIDHNDHFTVASYFACFADAALALLGTLDLGAGYAAREGRGCPTDDCYVRYRRELVAGDLLHVTSGVLAVEADALVLGHRLFESASGELCTTVEQRVRHVDLTTGAPVPLPSAPRQAAEARRVAWDGPPRERRPRPTGLAGFRDSARDTVKPWELDVFGRCALSALIHRFSAANGHAIAAFGLTPAYLREQRRGFSTFEFQAAFPGALHAGDAVVVRSALVHVGQSSLRLLHRMAHAVTGAPVAELEQFGVHLDRDTRRPTPLPDALRARAGAVLVPAP